jgi:hypothetical protein
MIKPFVTRAFASLLVIVASAFFAGCGSSSNPSGPVVTPTPVPTPTPTPTPEPDNLQKDTYCVPAPPPLVKIKLKIQLDFGYKKVLDSRAFVGPDRAYCASVGLPGEVCPVRDENDPMSVTCNNLVMGKALDTGRYGPTWYYNGELCRPIGVGGDAAGCRNHVSNQFFIDAFGPGTYLACGANGHCDGYVVQ